SGLLDAPADLGEIGPVLATVVPPAFDASHVEPAPTGVLAIHVGDLELTARRRLEAVDDLEDIRRVAIEADDRIVRRRRVEARVDDTRLLDDVDDPPVAVVREHAECLWIRHL